MEYFYGEVASDTLKKACLYALVTQQYLYELTINVQYDWGINHILTTISENMHGLFSTVLLDSINKD